MNTLNNKKILIASIVIIAVLVATITLVFNLQSDSQQASADLVYTNGTVPDGYVSDYAKTGWKISTWDATANSELKTCGLKQWLEMSASEDSPVYGYLNGPVTITDAQMRKKTVKYHYLDGCGKTVTIAAPTNTTVSNIVVESATFSNQSSMGSENKLDPGTNTCDIEGIITTYCNGTSFNREEAKTPFGCTKHTWFGGENLDSENRGCYTAGYIASIFAYSSWDNTKFEFNNNFGYSGTIDHGLSIGIIFGYMFTSSMNNCALSVNGKFGLNMTSGTDNDDSECLGTCCMGGYTGVIDKNSSITNSKINIANGQFLSVHVSGGNGHVYCRTFVGGIAGAIVNNSEIINTTATGSGHIRAWGAGSNYNRMGLSGIIVGSNISNTPAASAYTPSSMGSQESGASKATTGTVDGVICSWTGVAMFYIDDDQYIYGSSKGDAYFHGTALDNTQTTSCGEHFYGGLICAANTSSSINSIFYTFDKKTLSDIAYDTFRKVRQDEGQTIQKSKNCVGVQTVVIGTIPAANYFTLKMQQVNGDYVTTTGEYIRPTYTNASTAVTPSSLTGGPYYTDGTVSGYGTIPDSSIQTDIFGLEWSSQSQNANVAASVDATKLSEFNPTSGAYSSSKTYYTRIGSGTKESPYYYIRANISSFASGTTYYEKSISDISSSGLFVWSVAAYLNDSSNSANKACYSYANSMEDALTNYRQYTFNDSIMTRNATGATYVIYASLGYAGTYLLSGDDFTTVRDEYTVSKGSKTYNGETRMTIPTIDLYTLNQNGEYVSLNVLDDYDGVTKGATKTTLQEEDIWAVYKQGEAYIYGYDDIKDAGTYKLRVYNGESVASNANFKYDILLEKDSNHTNRMNFVAYKADNKYYKEAYKTSLWQPIYTYTINKKEVYASWKNNSNGVDGENYTVPSDFTYTGEAYNFTYEYTSGLISLDTNNIPMTYELISYARLSASNLERNNDYYTINESGNYVLVGKYTRDGDDKYFIDPLDSSNHIPVDKSVYYRRVYVPTDAVKNAGNYRITIGECTNNNYKLNDSLVRQYYVTVSPRTIKLYYRGMDALVYNSNPQEVTWAVTNHAGQLKVSSAAGVTAANANIVASYVFEEAALNFEYDANNGEYTIAGEYYVSISLASGAVSKNYLLPKDVEDITSAEDEVIFIYDYNLAEITAFAEGVVYYTESAGVYTKVPQNEAYDSGKVYYTRGAINTYGVTQLNYIENKLTSVTRVVTIQKASVSLLRQYTINVDSAAYVDKTNGKTYNFYSEIKDDVNPALNKYTTKSIKFKSDVVNASGYYEEENYKGYNNIACVIKGVEEAVSGKTYKYFDLIYIDPKFYPATESDGVYTVANDATPISIVASSGTYVVELSFDTEAYINYEETKFYVIYRVVGVPATIYIDATNTSDPTSETQVYLPRSIDYDTQDHINAYKDFGKVEGLVDLDKNKGAGLNYEVYKLNNAYTGTNFVTISGVKYEHVTSMINAGTYIVVVAHDTIPVAGYELSYKYGPFASATSSVVGIDGFLDGIGLPYFTVTVNQVTIKISVENANKFYSQEFVYSPIKGNIKYTVTEGEIFDSDITNVIYGFTSDGFAQNAVVGKYDVVANCTGSAAQNYNFIINETESFIVNRAPLQVTLNRNITKEYGTEFNLKSLTRSDLTITKYGLLTGDTLDTFKFLSDGASTTANVGVYKFIGTYEVATEYVYGTNYYLRSSATNDTYVYTLTEVPSTGFEEGKTYYVYNNALVTGTNIDNYYIEIVGNITITPKTITVEAVDPAADLAYDAQSKDVSVTFNGVNGYTVADVTSSTFNSTIHYIYKYAIYVPVDYEVAFVPGEHYYVYDLTERKFVEADIVEFAEHTTYYLRNEVYNVATSFSPVNTYYIRSGESAPYTYTPVVTVSTDAEVAGLYTYTPEHYDEYATNFTPEVGVTYYTRSGESAPYTYAPANVSGGFTAGVVYYTQNVTYEENTAAYNAATAYYTYDNVNGKYELAEIDPFNGNTYYLASSNYEETSDTVVDSGKTYYTFDGEHYNEAVGLLEFDVNEVYYEYITTYTANTAAYDAGATYYEYDDIGDQYDIIVIDPFNGGTYYVVDEITYSVVTKEAPVGTYYTYDGEHYNEETSLTDFVIGTTYYTYTAELYAEATTYQANVVYYTRSGAGTLGDPYVYEAYNIIEFADGVTYCTLSYEYNAVTSTDNFDLDTDYYTQDGTKYILAEGITAFIQGIDYFTYIPGHFDLAESFDADRIYYVVGADDVNAVVVYNNDADVDPINAGDYTVTVSSISGTKVGNYLFTSVTNNAWNFTITKREVTLSVDDFTMGYGDTKLTPTAPSKGYELAVGSKDFVESDINSEKLVLVFKADDMASKEPSVIAEDNVVYLELDGEAANNYVLHYATATESESYGSLTVTSKALVSLTLKNENIKYDKGNDLTSSVEVDSSKPNDFEMVKFEKLTGADPDDEDSWTEVNTVTVVGSYRVTIKLSQAAYESGLYSTTSPDDVVRLPFNVVKATWLVEDFKESDFAIYYNKLVFNGVFEGDVKISLDGVFDENTTNTITGLKAMTTYTVRIKVAESANYKESTIIQFNVKTSYDPNAINLQLTALGDKFGFKDIATYVSIRQNYDLVSEYDKATVDATKLNAAKARYDLLIGSGNKAIKVTKQVIGKAMNKTYQVAAAGAISGLGIILAGLSCFTLKKRGQKKKTMRKLNKKNLLVILVMLVTIASFTMLFVGCNNKTEEDPVTPVDDGKLTDTTFLTAAGNITDPILTVSLVSKADELEVYSRNSRGVETANRYLTIDGGTFTDVANSLTFRTDAFSSTKIDGYAFTGVVSDPGQYLGITEDGVTVSDATITINLNSKDNSLKNVIVVYTMVVDTIEYEATITVTPKA